MKRDYRTSTPVELSHDLMRCEQARIPKTLRPRTSRPPTQAARYDESLEQAKAIVHLAPNAPEGYLFMGNMLVMLERHRRPVYERVDPNLAAVESLAGWKRLPETYRL